MSSHRILVVEHDSAERLKLAAVLTEAGYDVSVAFDAKEGLASAESNPPHLLLCETDMPEMDGYELCRRTRSHQRLHNARVVLLSASSALSGMAAGLEAGADYWLGKPYERTALLDAVRTLLDEGKPQKAVESAEALQVRHGTKTLEVRCSHQQVRRFFHSMYQDTVKQHEELLRAHEDLRHYSATLLGRIDEQTSELRQAMLQRHKAEEDSRHRSALLDKAHEAIMLMDVHGCVQYWNKGAERLYGWTADEIMGKKLGPVLHDENHPAPSDALRIVLHKGDWAGELAQLTREGAERIVQSSWTLVRDDADSPTGILTINVDVTERKKLEAKFLRTQRLESIGMLAGGVAHDLNNLVGPILMAVQVLRAKIKGEDEECMLGLIESGARRATDVVQQVLAFSRGTSGKKVPLQIKHLLREMHDMAKGSFPPSIDLRLEYPARLPLVQGDATQLHQVIMNLCVNARDAMPTGGLLVLKAEEVTIDPAYAAMNGNARPGRYIRLCVKDTGTGIPPHLKEKIFDPFFTTKDPGAGTGLGLSTVLSIVRTHDGFLTVDSEPGSGTEFSVFLPVAEGPDEGPTQKDEKPALGGNGETVLIVDDEVIIREIVKTTLQAAGYRVLTASDGVDALALFVRRGTQIQVVVVDLLMPNLDGQATIKTLLKLNPAVGIIAISGHEDTAKAAGGHLPPSVPLLRKPFTVDKLIAAIHSVMHSPLPEEVEMQQNPSSSAVLPQ